MKNRFTFSIFLLLAARGPCLTTGAEDPKKPVPFSIFCPSRNGSELLFLKATPSEKQSFPGAELEIAKSLPLGFGGRTITRHSTKPILYISGAAKQDSQTNFAVVFLNPDNGEYLRATFGVVERDYSYLSLDRSQRFLLGCNYGQGVIDVYRLDENAFPKELVASLTEGRRAAHCVLPSPDNRNVYIPYVKDSNALYQYEFDAETGKLTALTPKNANPPEGTGPRHMTYHPSLPIVYFSEEQGLGVSLYKRSEESGLLTFLSRVRVVGKDAPKEGISASDIVMTPNGKFIYTGIRGHKHDVDAISRFCRPTRRNS